MLMKPILVVVNIVERCRQLIIMQAIARQILNHDVFQLLQFRVGLSVMLRERVNVIIVAQLTLQQRFHIREHCLLLKLHVRPHLMGILIVKPHYKPRQTVVRIKCLDELLTDKRQLEVDVILVTCLQILQQRCNGETIQIVGIAISIDGKVHHSKKSVSVNTLTLAHLPNRLVAKTQADAKRAKALKNVIVVANDRYHPIISLIHLMVLHIY